MPDLHLITGASSGVGALLTERLAAAGRTVVAVARSPDKLAALATKYPQRILPVAADVADWELAATTVKNLERDHGPVTTLINNAAQFALTPFATQRPADIRRMLATNLEGTMAWSQAVLPAMIARHSGRIINVASVAGTRGIPGQAAYCASKHAVVGFADALAQEVIAQGIGVSTICPGGIDTPLWDSTPYPGDRGQIMAPGEVVDLIEFLLSRPISTLYKRLVFFPGNEWH
jgi:NADP-dependent 3-hydroxy acid dehydrogenase YdfG